MLRSYWFHWRTLIWSLSDRAKCIWWRRQWLIQSSRVPLNASNPLIRFSKKTMVRIIKDHLRSISKNLYHRKHTGVVSSTSRPLLRKISTRMLQLNFRERSMGAQCLITCRWKSAKVKKKRIISWQRTLDLSSVQSAASVVNQTTSNFKKETLLSSWPPTMTDFVTIWNSRLHHLKAWCRSLWVDTIRNSCSSCPRMATRCLIE